MQKKARYRECDGLTYNSLEKIPGKKVCRLEKSDKWHFYVEVESNIEKEYDINGVCSRIKEAYKSMGVWALYGHKNRRDRWECLQVAQKTNRNLKRESIGSEIVKDISIMFRSIPKVCKNCNKVQWEDRAFYENVYGRHKCEECDEKIFQERFDVNCGYEKTKKNLSRRFDIYHKIKEEYVELAIICICNQEADPKKEKDWKEKCKQVRKCEIEYAQMHQAMYFIDIKFCSRKRAGL